MKIHLTFLGWLATGAAWLMLIQPRVVPAAADLTPAEIQQLSRFDGTAGLRDVPDFARAEMEPKVQRSYQEARALFAGRGADVARHFLTHTDIPPGNGAYFFLLEALADTDTALVLIRALWDPPKVESGPTIKVGNRSWLMERDRTEIHVAIESVLVNEAARSDARVVSALVDAVQRMRPKRGGMGAGEAGTVVSLLGRCAGPEATAALQQLAQDPEPSIRGLAVQGLGRTARAVKMESQDQSSTLATVVRALRSDPDSRARLEAATAIGKLGGAEGVQPLREALATERHPQVVDAIVLALEQLKAPLTDPQTCREVVGRTWEPQAARFPFACWRAGAGREALLEAATRGPAQLRALALYSLVEKTIEYRPQLLLSLVPRTAPPPRPGPAGAKAVAVVPIQPPRPPPPPQVTFDDATRDRLLASAVEVLSTPSVGFPGKGGEISYSAAQMVRDAMWEISGRKMALALTYADRISTPAAGYTTSGRYSASYYLWNKDKAAYGDYRRPRQAAAAALLAVVFGVLLAWKKTRRAGALLVVAALAWGVWTLFMTGVRELPPPPFQLLTVSAIAFLSAGLSLAGVTLLWRRDTAEKPMKALGRAGALMPVAAVLAFVACAFTRWTYIFPIGGDGWELVFDPIGSALLAAVVAAGLGLLDAVAFRRLMPAKP